MPAFTVPTGWEYYDSSKDTVTFARANHTSSLPDLVILKRSASAASNGSPATSKYTLKYVLGVDQTDNGAGVNYPSQPNALVDFSVRHVDAASVPESVEDASLDSIFAELALLLADANFKENVKSSLLMPS